jgi:hypothetical protein
VDAGVALAHARAPHARMENMEEKLCAAESRWWMLAYKVGSVMRRRWFGRLPSRHVGGSARAPPAAAGPTCSAPAPCKWLQLT